MQGVYGKAPAKGLQVLLPPEHRPGRQQEHRQGGDLEAAGRGARRAAHQHQQGDDHAGRPAQLGQVHGVVARRPGRHRLEQRPQDLLPQGQSVPLGQLELIAKEEQRRHQDQRGRGHQHQLALEAVGPQVPPVLPHVPPGEKADAAQDDEAHHREVHQRVPHIAGQGDEGRPRRAHQVEARVAEGGDGVEHRVPNPPQPHLRAEPRGQQQRPGALQQQHGRQDEPGPANDAPHLGRGDGLLHHPPLLQADPPARQHGDGHGHRHHAHAADLDQHDDDRLAEAGPILSRVLHHEPRHAGGGGGGEQGVEKGGPLSVPGGDGHGQQHRSRQDQQREADQNDPRRCQLLFFSKEHKDPSLNDDRRLSSGTPHYSIGPAPGLSKMVIKPFRNHQGFSADVRRHAYCSTPRSSRPPLFAGSALHFPPCVL